MLARKRPAWGLAWAKSGRGCLIRTPDADLVTMVAKIPGIGIDPVGTGTEQSVVAVAAGHETNPERSGPLGSEQIPDRISHHHVVRAVHAELVGGDEGDGIRFGTLRRSRVMIGFGPSSTRAYSRKGRHCACGRSSRSHTEH